jgi:hypothetical protein
MVAPGIRERLSENKQSEQKYYMERFNFEKIGDIESEEQYEVKISN